MQRLIAAVLCLIVSIPFAAAQTSQPAQPLPPRQFSHPDRIRYDSQCLTIDGKDVLIFSGSFHYFRCPKPLWRDRFAKIKEAGFNCVETYVAWNWHEREMPAGVDDFSKVDMTDLADWLKMAHEEFGLYTIIRPGPYICAEWAGGGFPAWLPLKKPPTFQGNIWLRSDEPEYLKWSKHWLDACNKVIVPEQITHKPAGKPGTILYQIENEYNFVREVSNQQKINHLKSLYRDVRAAGIDVPIFTCWTEQVRGSRDPDLRNVFDGPNSYPRWNIGETGRQVDIAKQAQLDAPGMIPECQGGWFASVGGTLSEKQDGVTAAQINGISLMALSHGVTILNYYMLFGGTNVGDWGARTQTTTYDYASPIRESGGVGDKYLAVKAIGGMLKQIGPTLARAQSVSCRPEGIDANVMVSARRAADGQTFIFCWNRSRERATEVKGTAVIANESPIELSCKLDPFGFKVLWLHQGQSKWLPEPAPAIERPSVPQPIQITQAQRAVGEAPDAWTDQSPGATLAASGVWDSRYVMYRTKFSLTPEQVEQFKTLQIKQPGSDPLLASVNAKLVAPSRYLTRESRIALGDNLHSGDNEITILYENQGYPNFGPAIEQPAGLTGGSLVYSKTPDVMLTQWKVHLLEGPPQQRSTPSTQPDFDDASWPGCTLDAQGLADLEHPIQPGAEVKNAAARTLFGRNNARAVFRTTLDVTDEMIKGGQTQLVFERLDDQGTVYVNGEEAGRVRSFTESLTIDGAKFLKPGKNVIVAVVTNREGDGGITKPVSLVGTQVERLELNWQLAKDLSQPKTWQPVTLGTDSSAADGQLMTWYQVEFELPEASKDVWIPWLAHIQASGNGMIWLNGQHLGRYWQVGPQTEFFLPECWLNFGSGKKNVLTMCLRPIDRPASLNAIEIAPYPNAAERR